MKNYKLWQQASKAFVAFNKCDDEVYKAVGDKIWHSDPINALVGEVWDCHMNTLLSILSEGKETNYWNLHGRFDSPGGASGLRPVAWYNTKYNKKEYIVRKGMSGFIPEQLEKIFKLPERRGYVLGLAMYQDLVDIENKWRKNETKTSSPKNKKLKRK